MSSKNPIRKTTMINVYILLKKVIIHVCFLFRPPVAAIAVRTDIVQSHFFFSAAGLRLEEYSFAVVAFRAVMVFRSRQGRV